MFILKDFIGGMLSEIARARVTSDAASVQIANQYLNHDILRSFPVPRMNIRDIKFELSFAIAPAPTGQLLLTDAEVQKNITYRLQSFMESIVEQSNFSAYFKKDPKIVSTWRSGLGALSQRLASVLSQQSSAGSDIAAHLSRVIENYFFEAAPESMRQLVPELLNSPLQGTDAGQGATMSSVISSQVAAIVQVAANVRPPASGDDPLSVSVLVGAHELEGIPPERLHKLSFVIVAADRKWVTLDLDGKKTYILDRS